MPFITKPNVIPTIKNTPQPKSSDNAEDLEDRIASKFNKEEDYPWLGNDTIKIRDV